MRMDGEPWLQPLPDNNSITVLEITNVGQAVMLATSKCIAQCVPHEGGKINQSFNELYSLSLKIDGSAELLEALESESGSSSSLEETEVV